MLWEVDTGNILAITARHGEDIPALGFLMNSNWGLFHFNTIYLACIDLKYGQSYRNIYFSTTFRNLAVEPTKGGTLATTLVIDAKKREEQPIIYTIATKKESKLGTKTVNNVRGLSYSPDGTYLAVSSDRVVTVWNVVKATKPPLTKTNARENHDILFSPKSDKVAYISVQASNQNSTMFVHDLASWGNPTSFSLPGPGYTLAFAPDGNTIAYGTMRSSKPTIDLYDLSSKKVTSLQGHSAGITSLSYTVNKKLFSASKDATIRHWICSCAPQSKRDCYTGPLFTLGNGPCKKGVQTCDSRGNWGKCVGEVVPVGESLDKIDNDCDGRLNNNHTDIEVYRLEAPKTAKPGSKITTKVCVVNNIPNTQSKPFFVRLFLVEKGKKLERSSPKLTGAPGLPTDMRFNYLSKASGTRCAQVDLTIPTNTKAGDYSIGAIANVENSILESNKTNNQIQEPITIQ